LLPKKETWKICSPYTRGKERDVDTIADEPNIGILTAYAQQRECSLPHGRRASHDR
jgi:hypothetical protein